MVIINKYYLHPSKRRENPRNYMVLFGNVTGFDGTAHIAKEDLDDLIAEAFPKGYCTGALVIRVHGDETFRVKILYSKSRLDGTASYGSYEAFNEEHPYDDYDFESETETRPRPPTYEEACTVFSRGMIMFPDPEMEKYSLTICKPVSGYYSFTDIQEVYLDLEDDFTVEECKSMGTSDWYLSKHIKMLEKPLSD